MSKAVVQAHIFYSGMVQGVGFRYSTHRIATGLGLMGWVKNLRDGRVEITVEGPKESIEMFQNEIDKQFGGYVRDKNIAFQDTQEQFKSFEIIL